MFAVMAGMAAAERVEAQCGRVDIDTRSASAWWCKCGFQENICEPHNPPQLYLKQTIVNTASCFLFSYDMLSGTSSTKSGSSTSTSVYTYDPANECDIFDCAASSGSAHADSVYTSGFGTSVSSEHYSGTIINCDTWDDGTAANNISVWPSGIHLTTISDCNSTTANTHLFGSYSTGGSSGGSGWYDSKQTITLSKPYTDDMLRGYLLAAMPDYSPWAMNANSAAYYILETVCGDGGCTVRATGGKMKYRFHVTDCQIHIDYIVYWDEVTTYPNNNPAPSVKHQWEEIEGTGDPVNGAYGSEHEVNVPATPSTITEENIELEYGLSDGF
jgi:hypothetical protein